MKFDLTTEQKRLIIWHYLKDIKAGRIVQPADAVLAVSLLKGDCVQGQIK